MITFAEVQTALLAVVQEVKLEEEAGSIHVAFVEGYQRAINDLTMLFADTHVWTETPLPAQVLDRAAMIRSTLRGEAPGLAEPARAMSAGASG
jgi:hypothetical protein